MAILDNFLAFNINAFNQILYIMTSNLYLFGLLVCAILTVIFSMKEELEATVDDEQLIL